MFSCSAGASDAAGGGPSVVPDSGAPEDATLDYTPLDVSTYETGPSPVVDAGPSQLCGAGCSPDDITACADWDGGDQAADAGDAALQDAGSTFSCQVERNSSGAAMANCRPAGAGGPEAPCLAASDCAPGYACVGEGAGGLCRPYCCEGNEACPTDHFCDRRPLLEPSLDVADRLRVPVCVVAVGCDLSKPPCTAAGDPNCACADELACMVVSGGKSSCVAPGMGQAGESCPCAWGHVCSQGTNTCLKLCPLSVNDPAPDCRCMAASDLPQNYGVCAGQGGSDGG